MKSISLLIAGLLLSLGAMAADTRTVTLDVTKMDCAVCPITVRKALEKVPGVGSAKVDFKTKRAVVAFDPAKTSTTYDESGQWYTVGDRGHVDADGYLYLSGRTAECINSGGVNIYPARIDEALAAAPEIIDGAAFGLPDEDLGEIVAAALVVPDGTNHDAVIESTINFCREQVGSQLTTKRVFIVKELPRSDAGKLYRTRLVQQFTGQ